MPIGTLPTAAQKIYEAVLKQAKADGKSDEDAAKIAWGAVKRTWKKNENGEWVRKALTEFSMVVTKASISENGERKIRMSASDTGYDVYGERMSTELFNNFVRRIKGNDVPPVFRSVLTEKSGWSGGMPYTSIAHYKSGVEGKNIPADITSVYVDGDVLKSIAVVRDTPLGNALWDAVKKDITEKRADRIRVSIGFLDLKHSHGDFVFTRDSLEKQCPLCENSSRNDKVYLDGILVHEAYTRVPANPRTDVEVEKSMADEIKTKADDAASIVGDELAAELEINKSTVGDDILVVKSEEPVVEEKAAPAPMEDDEEEHPTDCTCKACASKKEKSAVETPAPSPLDEAFNSLKSAIAERGSLPKEQALQEIQPMFDNLAEVIKSSFKEPEVVPAQVIDVKLDPALSELLTAIKSAVEEVNGKVQTLTDDVTILKSQVKVGTAPVVQEVTPRRSLVVTKSDVKPESGKTLSLRELARKSVGI